MAYVLSDNLILSFSPDKLSWAFIALVSFMWVTVGIFLAKYKEHMEHQKRFILFYVLTWAMLVLLGMAANYFTMYLSFEFMTLLSMPLVLHDGTKEAIAAAKKYLFYSIFGATMGLSGLFFQNCTDENTLRTVAFISIVGFSVKAGIFPLHAWLPTAHPVAPAPASAVLSGVITKGGVLCVIRLIYFEYGTELLAGTWVQKALIWLALITILMGSTMAYLQDVLKKRLAYSTVSQVSYILFGLFTMNPLAIQGALLHVLYHSLLKDTLFLGAGSIIFNTHKEKVSELRGIGLKLPVTMGCFSIASLGLIGIPPLSGFMSKWFLARGSLAEGLPVLSWLGPVILLVSAMLTALYLLPICIDGFFPGKDWKGDRKAMKEPALMCVSMIILTVCIVVCGFIGGGEWALF